MSFANCSFNLSNGNLSIGDIILGPRLTHEVFNLNFEWEYYNDYQDNFIYTLKQRLIANGKDYKITLIFKIHKLWLIEIRNDLPVDETQKWSDKELKNDIFELRKMLIGLNVDKLSWGQIELLGQGKIDNCLQIKFRLSG